jgi:hypothetical protein
MKHQAKTFFRPQLGLAVIFLSLAALVQPACSKEKKPEEKAKVAANAEKKEPKAKPKPQVKKPEVDKELMALAASVQTEEDFEEAVERTITAENLVAEVDKLEKELASAEE